MYKILIVEDDTIISSVIAKKLEEWGFENVVVEDFNNILNIYLNEKPHLILLDIKLPFYNGFYWCQNIRKISNTPIIFISSNNDNLNMVMAMNMGVDDYIVKPFDMDVLVAKVQALLRRSYSYTEEVDVLVHEDIILLLGETALLYQDQKVELTKNEFKILESLFRKKGKLVSKKELMMKLWDDDEFVNENTLSTNIMRLRKKLEEYGMVNLIVTKKGKGFVIYDKDKK